MMDVRVVGLFIVLQDGNKTEIKWIPISTKPREFLQCSNAATSYAERLKMTSVCVFEWLEFEDPNNIAGFVLDPDVEALNKV